MLSLSVIMPKVSDSYEPTGLVVRLDKFPIVAYQTVERECLDIKNDDPGYTRFPTLEKANMDDFKKYWQ